MLNKKVALFLLAVSMGLSAASFAKTPIKACNPPEVYHCEMKGTQIIWCGCCVVGSDNHCI